MTVVTKQAATRVLEAASGVAASAATGGTDLEIEAGLDVFRALEPDIQTAVVALVHWLNKKPRGTKKAEAAKLEASANAPGPAATTPSPSPNAVSNIDLSSHSLDPDVGPLSIT